MTFAIGQRVRLTQPAREQRRDPANQRTLLLDASIHRIVRDPRRGTTYALRYDGGLVIEPVRASEIAPASTPEGEPHA